MGLVFQFVSSDEINVYKLGVLWNRVSQIFGIFGPTVFLILLNERKLDPVRAVGGVVFHVGQACKAQ